MEVMDKQSALDYINQMFPTGLVFVSWIFNNNFCSDLDDDYSNFLDIWFFFFGREFEVFNRTVNST